MGLVNPRFDAMWMMRRSPWFVPVSDGRLGVLLLGTRTPFGVLASSDLWHNNYDNDEKVFFASRCHRLALCFCPCFPSSSCKKTIPTPITTTTTTTTMLLHPSTVGAASRGLMLVPRSCSPSLTAVKALVARRASGWAASSPRSSVKVGGRIIILLACLLA